MNTEYTIFFFKMLEYVFFLLHIKIFIIISIESKYNCDFLVQL